MAITLWRGKGKAERKEGNGEKRNEKLVRKVGKVKGRERMEMGRKESKVGKGTER